MNCIEENKTIFSISVVIPCRNEEKHIAACLDSVLACQSEQTELTVFVCDGLSTDSTRSIIENYCGRFPNLSMIDNPQQTTPMALNIGISHCQTEYIAILGAHATVSTTYFNDVAISFTENPEADCIGGLIENVFMDERSRAVGFALASTFGVGSSNFRTGVKGGYVDTVAFGIYRRSVFAQIGLFDETLARNQDDEFSYRMLKNGLKIFLDLKIRSYYHVRSTWSHLFRQFYQYGFWKVFVNKKHQAVTTIRQLVPFLFVSAIIINLVLAFIHPAFAILLGSLLTVWLVTALLFASSGKRSISQILQTIFSFLILHIGYGSGYLVGIFYFIILRQNPSIRHSKLTR
ncbi:MAG: hypothetical protein CVU06_06275 [Bacteroidetes bacterium HGW-Bacteroidetes-22]|nr:MAG: hypothetical protein CVU06_06275 [Bacteroidetes bacterium HGW-Bacteroidetes-22]